MRKTMFILTLLVGLGLAVTGFALAAPLFGVPSSEANSNPDVPFAAGIFVLGVMIVFLSPVVYELYPDERA